MKKVEAFVRLEALKTVKRAILSIGTGGLTYFDAHGVGEQRGATISYRGIDSQIDRLPRVKVEVIVEDDEVESVVEAIYKSAYTGEIGDGLIIVVPIETLIRTRTGETIATPAYA